MLKREMAKAESEAAAAAAALAERKRVAAEEEERRGDLASKAARWHQPTQIRAYIAHLGATGPVDGEWRAWALKVAEEMDPTTGRLQRVETPPPETPTP